MNPLKKEGSPMRGHHRSPQPSMEGPSPVRLRHLSPHASAMRSHHLSPHQASTNHASPMRGRPRHSPHHASTMRSAARRATTTTAFKESPFAAQARPRGNGYRSPLPTVCRSPIPTPTSTHRHHSNANSIASASNSQDPRASIRNYARKHVEQRAREMGFQSP